MRSWGESPAFRLLTWPAREFGIAAAVDRLVIARPLRRISPLSYASRGREMKAAQLFDVRGQVCIVTGGASGIGLACGEVMAENGARVFLGDVVRRLMGGEAVLKRLVNGGSSAYGAYLD